VTLYEYAGMLVRSTRIAAFREAIEEAVQPGSRVLDLGTGLGTYAFFAARAGAARVVAVESAPVIHLARALARRNGLADRVELVHARAPGGIPEGPYDLVVFEDWPATFLDAGTWSLVKAVGSAHLAPGGRILPGAFRLTLAPVVGGAWSVERFLPDAGAQAWGLDWRELRVHLANVGRRVHLEPGALGAPGEPGPRVPSRPLPGPGELGARGVWRSTGEPVVGLALWMDLEVADGRWVSNRPRRGAGEPWGQWLLPVDPPLEIEAGTPVAGRVWREVREDGAPGWMGWSCEAAGQTRRGHDFAGLALAREDLEGASGA